MFQIKKINKKFNKTTKKQKVLFQPENKNIFSIIFMFQIKRFQQKIKKKKLFLRIKKTKKKLFYIARK